MILKFCLPLELIKTASVEITNMGQGLAMKMTQRQKFILQIANHCPGSLSELEAKQITHINTRLNQWGERGDFLTQGQARVFERLAVRFEYSLAMVSRQGQRSPGFIAGITQAREVLAT